MQMATPCFYKILLKPSDPQALPSAFVTKHFENNVPTNTILRSTRGGYTWPLQITKIGENYCFAHGWSKVVEDAQLRFGDFLVFSLVDQSTFKVCFYSPSGCEKDLPLKDKTEDDSVDEDGEGDEAGDDDPFFTTTISKTSLHILRLPKEFARLAGLDIKERSINVKNLAQEEWETSLKLEQYQKGWVGVRSYLCGWAVFRRSNGLSEGDECVFKYITSEDKLSLVKVTKNEAGPSQPPPATSVGRKKKKKRGRRPS